MRKLKDNHYLRSLLRWIDGYTPPTEDEQQEGDRVDWFRILPFMLLHLGCLGVIWVGISFTAVAFAAGLYLVRMFAITGIYHRYFSHRTYKVNRFWQFAFAVLGNSAVQRGPLWWASHHRHHHKHSDTPDDPHSPMQRGFWWSHVGWFTTLKNFPTRAELVGDWMKYPELRFLDRYCMFVPMLLLLALYALGEGLSVFAPATGTSGPQLVVWGFFISTVLLFHATATINSLDHMIGRRRYDTPDSSRNNWLLALITLGEGWHNNHHHYPAAARQGFYWWELDITYIVLKALSRMGIVRDLRPVPAKVLAVNRASPPGAGPP